MGQIDTQLPIAQIQNPKSKIQNPMSFTPELTADGSYTFFSEEFGEWFHSREGAYAEAHQTYVTVTQLEKRAAATEEIALLDVCYGLGYNTAAALEAIWQVNPVCKVTLRALEINPEVPKSAVTHHLTQAWSSLVQTLLATLADQQQVRTLPDRAIDAALLIGDARQTIQTLVGEGYQADVIFLDPFSPTRCPQLWTVEFIQLVARCLKSDGRLATYSCAAAARTALTLAGLSIGSTQAAGRRWPGTVASYRALDLPPLSPQEQAHLKTRAAVPYCDPRLQGTADEIVTARKQAQALSPLVPTGQWRRRWLT
ncbi:MAG: MnmC family methyltransferase [Cyanobacteria bacterium P01_D01_bin.44]